MFFDGQDFPAKSAVGWVSVKDLRDSGAKSKNSLVPHIQSVRKFLESRVAKHSPKPETDETRAGIPNTTEEQPIKLNTSSAMLLDVQPEPHEAHGSTPELGQRESEHPLLIQPTPSSSNKVSRSGSQVQSQPQPGISDEEERKLPPGLEVISTSSHRSEEQPDEPLGNLYNLEVPRASCLLTPFGFMLQQDMGSHPPLRELHSQVPTDTDGLFSHCTSSMQAPPVPIAASTPSSPHTRLPTTQPTVLSPAVKPSCRQPASSSHPVTHHPIGQNYGSLGFEQILQRHLLTSMALPVQEYLQHTGMMEGTHSFLVTVI
ncbi:hypothetical protein FOFC_15890 [Fusarium oxysporum]|nr:hypothetical protein FOFC_15890 [Fusarium oxysporum]